MFEQIERVPGDAILGLIEAFKKDINPQKVDLGVGVYRDAAGNTPVMRAVKEAEARLLKNETTKTYIEEFFLSLFHHYFQHDAQFNYFAYCKSDAMIVMVSEVK